MNLYVENKVALTLLPCFKGAAKALSWTSTKGLVAPFALVTVYDVNGIAYSTKPVSGLKIEVVHPSASGVVSISSSSRGMEVLPGA